MDPVTKLPALSENNKFWPVLKAIMLKTELVNSGSVFGV